MKRPLFYLICDESGAKGYSNKLEQGSDSLGLVAGLIIHESQFPYLQKACAEIHKKHSTDSVSKFHMTDLPSNKQNDIRNEVFNAIKSLDARLVYSSVTKAGMNKWYNIQKKLRDDNIEKEKERGYGICFHDPKESMLEMLYIDVISNFFATIIDYHVNDGDFDAHILIDNIDTPILSAIKEQVSELITDPSYSKENIKSSRFHYKTGVVEKSSGTIEFNIKIPDSLKGDELNNITFEIQLNDSLAIFPDVVANSLRYFAKNNLQNNTKLAMNSAELIAGHPLEKYFVALSRPEDWDFFRALYSHNNENGLS